MIATVLVIRKTEMQIAFLTKSLSPYLYYRYYRTLSAGSANTLKSMQKSAAIAPKNNLSEQIEWLQTKKRSNALQHCLNSDAIQRYVTRQKPPQSTTAPISASELKKFISIGASKIKLFKQFSDPTTASALLPTPQSLYDHQIPTECIDLTTEESKVFPIQRNEQSPTRLETDDTLFDQVDVDALVANYRQKQAGDSLNHQKWSLSKAQNPQPTKKNEMPMRQHETLTIENETLPRQSEMATRKSEMRMRTSDVSTNEDLLSQIKRVRERLRGAREACDDASLYGNVPSKLQEDRIKLENELEMLGQKFRQRSATTIDPIHRHPIHRDPMQSDQTEQTSPIAMSPNVRAKMLQAKGVLRDIFGHTTFRPNQERVIHNAFEKRDIFVLMPTGGGKSLCYQLPACVDDGLTVVISPLVSLIQDQVQQLQALDVGVAYLNGEQDYETVQRPIVSELFSSQNRIKLLYVTPEKIASSGMLTKLFESLENRSKLARFVIDEAHCISQWGHDFRKDYMNLGQLRRQFPSVRIMALTATANSQTEADIVKNLQLENPFITRSSFNRPNLTYDVRKKGSSFLSEIADFVRNHSQDSGIIYCLSKKDCEQTVEKLIKLLGYEGTKRASRIAFYHAGLEPEDRSFRHHEWSKGNVKLIVATIAFGMGINKPDVRYVIHYTIPQSVTHYYQVRRSPSLPESDKCVGIWTSGS
uniref:DNA 3'-5' helicase n=1 Tax=Albugo laibachii Nc14 TaxID=890382 RepID=F0WRP6_9STRA|nr:bloom syndrome protein putative [Albugo laibachii Nc14]|eukprot:CCA24010.1 bloom syndrome protein putative [Albugo laibachii Nc14]